MIIKSITKVEIGIYNLNSYTKISNFNFFNKSSDEKFNKFKIIAAHIKIICTYDLSNLSINSFILRFTRRTRN